ncbi:MAG: FAD-dependent oxidoreductase, partial [Acidimicrobiales bacterium]
MHTPNPPTDHRPSDLTEHTFDVIVLGAGSTGENVVSRAVAGGLSVAVVEPELVGGECSYWACMPSKALLRGSQALGSVRQVDGAKQAVTGGQDVARTLQRRDKFNSGLDDTSQVQWVESTGAT